MSTPKNTTAVKEHELDSSTGQPLSHCCFDAQQYADFRAMHDSAHFQDARGVRFGLRASRRVATGPQCFLPPVLNLCQFLQQRDTFCSIDWQASVAKLEPIENSVLGPFVGYFAQRRVILGFCLRLQNESYGQQFYWLSLTDVLQNRGVPNFTFELFILTLYGREKLCRICGNFYDDDDPTSVVEELKCSFHDGVIEVHGECFGAIGWEDIERWSCCNMYQHSNKTCKTGPHVPLLLNGFAPTLTHWEQIRLILAWKRECRSGEAEAGGLFLLQEIIDVIVFALVELNDAEFYKKYI
jgi:hypothetical protein